MSSNLGLLLTFYGIKLDYYLKRTGYLVGIIDILSLEVYCMTI